MDVTGPLPSYDNSGSHANSGFVYVMAALAALTGLLFGYDTGVISGALPFVTSDFNLSTGAKEIVTSAVLAGAVIGALFSGRVTDAIGRRNSILIIALIFTAGALGAGFAPTVGWLIAARVIIGLAIGVGSYVGPLYISEVSPAEVRGRLVTFNQLAITGGILVAYLADYALADFGGWRWMFGVAVIPSLILLAGMFFMPESPRWLLKQGRTAEARSVLSRTQSPDLILAEMNAIRESEYEQKGNWRDLFRGGPRRALIIGVGLAIFQQITGINTVIYYAPTIFQSAGFGSAQNSILPAVIIGIVNFAMTIVALPLPDRVGRRPLLLIGLIGQFVGLVALGIVFLSSNISGTLGWLAVLGMVVYVGFFAIALGPVFWLLISEIYPLRVRGLGASVATVANWGSNLVVSLTFLSLLNLIGTSFTFWLFAVMCIFSWIFTYYLVPETKGRTLEQIEAEERAGFSRIK
ncbi:MAG TPA: sugar porter family MFS transporter [Chloroflexia bacterium]|nr:sugar porter family MFS transporter [Chloroflexia bacterium]